MANDEENLSTDQKVRRSVRKTLGWAAGLIVVLGLAGFWASFGFFTLEEGRAAVILRLGKHVRTITQSGLHFVLPPPFDERVIVNVTAVRNEDFGFRGDESAEKDVAKILEATMQTGDNNIVRASFAVQYTVKDAFQAGDCLAEVREGIESAI